MSLSRVKSEIAHGSDKFDGVVDIKPFLPEDTKVFIGKDNSDDGIIFWTRMRPYMTVDHIKRNDSGLAVDEIQAISVKDPEADSAFITSAREFNKEMADRVYEKHFKNGTNN